MELKSDRYIVLDFETTGLDVIKSAIIEIAAIKMEKQKRAGEFYTLINPGVEVETGAFLVHGISNQEIQLHGKEPQNVYKDFSNFIADYYLVAHNGIRFDFILLANTLSRYKIELRGNCLLDTMLLSRRYNAAKTSNHTLGRLCKILGITNTNRHRAQGDTEATLKLFTSFPKVEDNLDKYWQESLGLTLSGLLHYPPHSKELTLAITQNRDVLIHYRGKRKPARQRWIKPLRLVTDRQHNVSVAALCPEQDTEKQFRLDRILRIIKMR